MLVVKVAVVGESRAFFRCTLLEAPPADLGMHPRGRFTPSLAERGSALLVEQTLAGRGHCIRDGSAKLLGQLSGGPLGPRVGNPDHMHHFMILRWAIN